MNLSQRTGCLLIVLGSVGAIRAQEASSFGPSFSQLPSRPKVRFITFGRPAKDMQAEQRRVWRQICGIDKSETEMVPVANGMHTCMDFRHSGPPPWEDGNLFSLIERIETPDFGPPVEMRWQILNMNSENFYEITRRLDMDTIQVRIFGRSTTWVTSTHCTTGKSHRELHVSAQGFVVDPRIPRAWFNTSARLQFDEETAILIEESLPEYFRNPQGGRIAGGLQRRLLETTPDEQWDEPELQMWRAEHGLPHAVAPASR